jgi:hypothetical protein
MAGEGLNARALELCSELCSIHATTATAVNDQFCMERGFAGLGSRLLKGNKRKTQR